MTNSKRYEDFKQALRETSDLDLIRIKLGLSKVSKVYYLLYKAKKEGIIFSPRRGVYHKRVENYFPIKGEQQNILNCMGD